MRADGGFLMRDGGYGRLRLTHAKTRRRKVGQLCKLSTGRGAQVADKLKTCPTLQPQRGYPPSFIRHHISPLAAIAHPTSDILHQLCAQAELQIPT